MLIHPCSAPVDVWSHWRTRASQQGSLIKSIWGQRRLFWQEVSSSIKYVNQQLSDMNSHVGAEKHMRFNSSVFLDKSYALLAASASLLWGTESTTSSISSGLESLLCFLPGFLGPPSPWLLVIALWSCSSPRVSMSHIATQNSTICTPDPRGDFSTCRPAHRARSFLCL